MSGRYQVVRSIAKGGMAEVFLAKMTGEAGFAKSVALKRLPATLAADPEVVKMLMDEARLAARLNHPQVVQVFDFGHDDDGYYIAMEYVEGPDLNTVLKYYRASAQRPPEAPLLSAMIQALRGLDYAHRLTDETGKPLGVVHRDVSPSNVLVTAEGVAKMSDFGIAKAQGRATETRVGAIKGKLPYMSPEQARGRPVDARTDVLSAGLVTWECVVGRRCYDATADNEILRQAAYAQHSTFAALGLEVDPELQDIVERALRHDPLERFQTAGEMAQALERYHRRAHAQFRPEDLGAVVKEVLSAQRTSSGAFVAVPRRESMAIATAKTDPHQAPRVMVAAPEPSAPFKARPLSMGRAKVTPEREPDPSTEWGLGGAASESEPEPTINVSANRGPAAPAEPSGELSSEDLSTSGRSKRPRPEPEPSGGFNPRRAPGSVRPAPPDRTAVNDSDGLGGPTQRQIAAPPPEPAPAKPTQKNPPLDDGEPPKLEGQGMGFFGAVGLVLVVLVIGAGVFVGISVVEREAEGPGAGDPTHAVPAVGPVHPKAATTSAAVETPPLKTFPEPDAGLAVAADPTVAGGANPPEEPAHASEGHGKRGKHHKGEKTVSGEGSMEIGCTPGCDVFIDGNMIAPAPIKGLTLAAGTHEVRVKNTTLNAEKKAEIEVRPNETVIKTFTLP